MQKILTKKRSLFAGLVACLMANAACTDGASLEASDEVSSETQLLTGSGAPPVIPAMKYLAHLPAEPYGEQALAKLFARGTVDHVPTGDGTGYPVLFHSVPELNWLASQLWGGKTLKVVSPETHPNGDPIVVLDNKIIKTPAGAVFNLFDAYVTRSVVGDLDIGTNDKGQKVLPPVGELPLVPVSFLHEPIVVDGKPSVILNYFDDSSLPVIRRILDEIREVDAVNCPGLYLGRAHARRCVSLSCGEFPSAILDFPEHPTFETKYQWGFWTYFLLNFGQPAGTTCDISKAVATAEQDLRDGGVTVTLPVPGTN